jgi:hypothetical protein
MLLSLGLFCRNRCIARYLQRGFAQPAPSSAAPAHHRLISAAAAAHTATVPAQLMQWTRAASDTVVTSARPLAPSDASHDGIAKVS